jgi:hypothetical protein
VSFLTVSSPHLANKSHTVVAKMQCLGCAGPDALDNGLLTNRQSPVKDAFPEAPANRSYKNQFRVERNRCPMLIIVSEPDEAIPTSSGFGRWTDADEGAFLSQPPTRSRAVLRSAHHNVDSPPRSAPPILDAILASTAMDEKQGVRLSGCYP